MSIEDLPPSIRQQVARYQQVQQTLNVLVMERQQLEAELAEVNNALEELSKTSDDATLYRVAGQILVKTDKERLVKELTEKKELTETRLKVLERQEGRTRSQLDELQKELQRALSGQPSSQAG